MHFFERRKFLHTIFSVTAILGGSKLTFAHSLNFSAFKKEPNRFKLSLNAYSFNELLKAGKTNLEEVMEFCTKVGFDAIDLTGYYFPGYPEVPNDEYIFHLKRKAHTLGLGISGTGIRNDFGDPDQAKRDLEIIFVKKWIDVAAKLGAPVIRIFTAKNQPTNYSWEETANWIIEDIKKCAAYGKEKGVIVAIQNHNDFIKTADQAIYILNKVNSVWFGLVLDTGSFVTLEPYSEIKKITQFAVNWQIKEKLNYNGNIADMDLEKLFRIIYTSKYRGFLPIETLSPGNPFDNIRPFLQLVKSAMNNQANT